MSKSRGSDENHRDKGKDADVELDKEKHGEKYTEEEGNARAEERTEEEEEDNARGQNVQLPMNRMQLTAETESNLKLSILDSNRLTVKKEQGIPSFPPPSYEHVIEQTRREHATEVQKYGEGNSQRNDASGGDNRTKGPKILHKSSKELYRAVAKQWGITCKMSDQCRCLDCQSCYFDCEYKNESDGGLGAGSPVFISEVMQGSACVLL